MLRYEYNDYKEYLETQIETNILKSRGFGSGHCWAHDSELKAIGAMIVNEAPSTLGICHGVRTGHEVRVLRGYLQSDVIGTDLETNGFSDVYKWDFNQQNDEWVGRFGWVYSNAFDHCYDPEHTLEVWVDQTMVDGFVILHWTAEHEKINRVNCIGGGVNELEEVVDRINCSLTYLKTTKRRVVVITRR